MEKHTYGRRFNTMGTDREGEIRGNGVRYIFMELGKTERWDMETGRKQWSKETMERYGRRWKGKMEEIRRMERIEFSQVNTVKHWQRYSARLMPLLFPTTFQTGRHFLLSPVHKLLWIWRVTELTVRWFMSPVPQISAKDLKLTACSISTVCYSKNSTVATLNISTSLMTHVVSSTFIQHAGHWYIPTSLYHAF